MRRGCHTQQQPDRLMLKHWAKVCLGQRQEISGEGKKQFTNKVWGDNSGKKSNYHKKMIDESDRPEIPVPFSPVVVSILP